MSWICSSDRGRGYKKYLTFYGETFSVAAPLRGRKGYDDNMNMNIR
jgi:hypothetical protein